MRKAANDRRNQEVPDFYGGFLTNAVVTVSWQSGSIAVNETVFAVAVHVTAFSGFHDSVYVLTYSFISTAQAPDCY